MSRGIQRRETMTLREFRDAARGRAGNFADRLPAGMSADHFLQGLISAAHKNPALLRCNQTELFGAAYSIASLGLELDPEAHQAYIVPYKGKPTPVLDYRGLVELAIRSGKVFAFHADVVREGDEFDHWTDENGPHLRHRPAMGGRYGRPLIGCYAVAQLAGGNSVIAVLDDSEIDHIKSGISNLGPAWRDHEPEKWKITAVRRACKLCPKDSALRRALALVDAEMAWHGERNRSTPAAVVPPAGRLVSAAEDTVEVQVEPERIEQGSQVDAKVESEPAKVPAKSSTSKSAKARGSER